TFHSASVIASYSSVLIAVSCLVLGGAVPHPVVGAGAGAPMLGVPCVRRFPERFCLRLAHLDGHDGEDSGGTLQGDRAGLAHVHRRVVLDAVHERRMRARDHGAVACHALVLILMLVALMGHEGSCDAFL